MLESMKCLIRNSLFDLKPVIELEKHFDRINNMKVIVCVEKKRQKTESTIRISSGEPHAAPKNKDLYATINRLTNKVDRQLVKKKEPKHRTDVYKMKLMLDR
jgi:ribosomal subunit interface protein